MHTSIKNLTYIQDKIKDVVDPVPTIIAVSKTFQSKDIEPLLNFGHVHYGENKVQECKEKWHELKIRFNHIKLHMIGKLQTNKVKLAVQLFDYIHSVDSEKLAKKIADEQLKINKKVKVFLQVNIGNEDQKSGINKNDINKMVSYCKQIDINLIGLMCIPPAKIEPEHYFKDMYQLNKNYGFKELSMGMSSDFIKATRNLSTYLRIGSSIFGQRF